MAVVVPQPAQTVVVAQPIQTVVVNQPIQNQLIVGPKEGHRDWTTGLCGCFEDVCSMCKVYCFLSCTICEISTRLGDFPCMPWFVPGGMIALRTRLRTLGGIRGSICGDCMVLSCCPLCGICQMDRELKAMGL